LAYDSSPLASAWASRGRATVAGVELADELEQAGAGGVEVGRKLGDLVPEAIELGNARVVP
jgi:hypothetical protein